MPKSTFRLSVILISIAAILFASKLAGADDYLNKAKLIEEMINNPPPATGPTDDPPPAPVIAVAEWEPASGVLISYPLQIPMQLVIELAEDIEVMTTVTSEQQMLQALHAYVLAGADTSNCSFLFIDSYIGPYTRDHGPWYIFNGNDEQGMIANNYIYHNWVVANLGDSLGIPVYETGVNSEGGNYMTNGMGTAIVTKYLYWENPSFTPAELDAIMIEYLGFDYHITVPLTPNMAHIDTWAKFLDPGRILVISPDDPNPVIEDNVNYFQTLMSGYGRPYEIIRIEGSGYSNTLILNNKVLVPLFGNPNDSMALVTWEEAMPGYEVYGFYWPTFNFGDALHCRTHEMADRYMLRIVHVPLHDCENDGDDYYLEANIHPYSNEPLTGSPMIYWKLEGGAYQTAAMTSIGGDDCAGYIPQQPDETDIYYYIEAEDGSGRIEDHPYIGPGNPHHFHVGPDTEPPVVEFDPPEEITSAEWPIRLIAYALDNRWISLVTLEWLINGSPQDDIEMPLESPYAVYYTCTTTGAVLPGDVIEVRVKAVDTSINQNTAYDPPTDYYVINVSGTTAEPEVGISEIPTEFKLYPAHPNPFNPTTAISFDLPETGEVSLTVYDVLGREVARLVAGQMVAGNHQAEFDGKNFPSGVYFYSLEAGDIIETRKCVLMK